MEGRESYEISKEKNHTAHIKDHGATDHRVPRDPFQQR